MNYKKQEVFILPKALREEVLFSLKRNAVTYHQFLKLTVELQEELIGFCMGNRGLKITYDPFFKVVFDPIKHKERLEQILSCIIGEQVKIKQILPNESRRLAAEASLLIMDILVELESGKLVNLEIQKLGYGFPGQRSACYSSDLVMREYSKVKEYLKDNFNYRNMERVITIILMEKSTNEFHKVKSTYIHRFKQTSDSHLELNLLQEYIFIALDIFKEITHNISTELDAWMYFLGSDEPSDILRVVEMYPYFKELYEELIKFQRKPKELVNMFSEELEIMDRNTVRYMIDEEKKKVEELKQELLQVTRERDQKLRQVTQERDQKLQEGAEKIKVQELEIKRLREALESFVRQGDNYQE